MHELCMETCGRSYIDDEGTQLILLQRDDFVIAGLLCQLQQGARRCQPQPRHVWFTGEERGREQRRKQGFLYLSCKCVYD